MKRTENYKLPQIELEDNYDIEHFNDGWRKTDEELKRLDVEVQKRVNYDDTEIRELICDTNASLDNKANKSEVDNNINELDVKIAENKSLTDSEIAKLKEIANTWESFKNSGGEINGGIQAHALKNIYTLTSGEKERCYYFGSLNNFDTTIGMEILDKKSGFDTKVELAQGGNPTLGGQGYFGSSHDLITNLGSDNKRWKDVWVGSYSKNDNGYTKLPNGLIMQWATLNLPPTDETSIYLPISFPNKILSMYATPRGNRANGAWSIPWWDTRTIKVWNGSNIEINYYVLAIGY